MQKYARSFASRRKAFSDHPGMSIRGNALPLRYGLEGHGWCRQATRVQSPNCDARPEGTQIDLLVLHNISLPAGQFGGPYIEKLFTNRLIADEHPSFGEIAALKVSAHFLIRRDGELIQFVACDHRAWHAGVSSFAQRERCNDFSIGVELEGTDDQPFDDAQYQVLARLTRALRRHYPLRFVAGHRDIAPQRKTDPGPCFDWPRYLKQAGLPLSASPFGVLPR